MGSGKAGPAQGALWACSQEAPAFFQGGRCLGRGGDRRKSRASREGSAKFPVGWVGVERREGAPASCHPMS